MKHKLFYGTQPTFTNADRSNFSLGKYECKALMKNAKGAPVVISQNTNLDFPVWKVEHDFSTVVFATYEEAMAYCNRRFSPVGGR